MNYITYIAIFNIKVFFILISLGFSYSISGQINLNNPSFEDTPSDATTPMGWFECEEHTTPDILPGYWGVYNEASEGETFVGMITRENGTFESIGQRTSEIMRTDNCYSFSVDLAHSRSYSGYNKAIKLRIWIADEKCGTHQKVFESDLIENLEWETHQIKFIPEKEARYIIIEAFYKDGWFKRKGNILVDHITPIRNCNRV